MICPKCGFQNASNGKFCEGCGQSLAAPIPTGPPHCPACGVEVKASTKFCPECGSPIIGAANPSVTAPAPAPPYTAPQAHSMPGAIPAPSAIPSPAPAPSAPTYRAQSPLQQPLAPVPSYVQRKGNRGCAIGCAVVAAICFLLCGAVYWGYTTVLLSRPEAFAGTWEVSEGKSKFGKEKFKLEVVSGGLKLLPADGTTMPIEIILKPAGTRKMATTISNPKNASEKADISVELNTLGSELALTAKLPGEKEEVSKAKRVLVP